MTAREEILAAVRTALTGTTGVSTRIYRSRVEALSRNEHPAITIEPVQDTPERNATQRLDWNLTFAVTLVVRAENPETSSDATVADIHSKIMGDAPLNNLLVDLLPGSVDFQFVDADLPLEIIQMQYKATYQTDTVNLSSL